MSRSLPTRETPREFGFRLTLSGFSIKTACAISKNLRLRFDPSSSVSARFLVLRFYPSPFGRCRSVRHPKVPYGHRPTLRQYGVTRRDLGGPDGHWHLSPKSATPIRGADRSRSARRPSRSFAQEVSLRCDGGPESPSSGSLFRPKPSERVGTYGRSAHYVNRIGWSVFACLPDFSRPGECIELHRCGSRHSGAV